MSLLFETIVKPDKSEIYFRLVLVLYAWSMILTWHTSLYLLIKLIIILFLLIRLQFEFIHKSPCLNLLEFRGTAKKWVLFMKDGQIYDYNQMTILIHNPFFQLIKFISTAEDDLLLQRPDRKKNKLLILFNDQLPKEQWRVLHFYAANDGL